MFQVERVFILHPCLNMATKVKQNKVTQRKRATSATKSGARARVQRSNQPSEIAVFLRQYAPAILLVFFAVLTGVLLFVGYRAVTATSIFNLKNVDVSGTNRVEAEDVRQIVKRTATKTGVWNAEINEIRDEIEKLGWVKSAVVSRVLPDSLRVRVFERTPKAIVRNDGKTFWVDEAGKQLGATGEKDATTIVLQGWESENANTDLPQKRNLERLALFAKLQEDLKKAGILERVKTIGLEDLQNVKIFVAVADGTQIPIYAGKEDLVKRVEDALLVVDGFARNGELGKYQYFISKDGSVNPVPKSPINTVENKPEKKTK